MNLNLVSAVKACVLVVVLALVTPTASADIKAATVDVETLLLDCHQAKLEIHALKAERDQYLRTRSSRQKILIGLTGQIREVHAKLKHKAMPRTERINLEKQVDELMAQHQSLTRELSESDANQIKVTNRQITAATHKLLDELQTVIRKYAGEQGYQWVIDTSGISDSQTPALIYARKAVDITDNILAILNASGPREPARQH